MIQTGPDRHFFCTTQETKDGGGEAANVTTSRAETLELLTSESSRSSRIPALRSQQRTKHATVCVSSAHAPSAIDIEFDIMTNTKTSSHPAEVASHPPSSPHAAAPSTPDNVVVDVDGDSREVRVHNARLSFASDDVAPGCGGARSTNAAVTQIYVCDDDGNERLSDTLSPGRVMQLPFPPGSVLVARDETGAELTRWTVLKRRERDVQSKTLIGKEYTKTIYEDPKVQHVVIGDWADWRRLLRPKELDYDLTFWDEPMDDPTTGKVTAPFAERFCYYIVRRHQVLQCFFVAKGDSYSPGERKFGLLNTMLYTFFITMILQTSGGYDPYVIIIAVTIFVTPIATLFTLASRVECCKIQWGRLITVPMFLFILVFTVFALYQFHFVPDDYEGGTPIETVYWSFFTSLFLDWLFLRPGGIALRVYLYEIGWLKWFGIGPKNKWCLDQAANSAGLG